MKIKNKSTQKWWNDYAEKFDLEVSPFESNEARETEWEAVYKNFKTPQARFPKLVDLGCGPGHFALNFAQRGFQVTGIDVSQKSLKVLEKRAQKYGLSDNLSTIHHGLFTPLPKLERTFDAGYMTSTYHCISNKREEQAIVLRNFIKLIKKGGKILIMESNPLNPFYYLYYPFAYRWNWREGYNIVNSRKSILKGHLRAMGMDNIQVFYHSFLPTSLINKWRFIKKINLFWCRTPIIKNFSAFHIVTAVKRDD